MGDLHIFAMPDMSADDIVKDVNRLYWGCKMNPTGKVNVEVTLTRGCDESIIDELSKKLANNLGVLDTYTINKNYV